MKIPKKFRFQLVRRRGERSIFSWPRASYRKGWGEGREHERANILANTVETRLPPRGRIGE